MDLQHWSIINLEMVNWKIYLLFGGIKNEVLEVVETPQTPPSPSLKSF